MTKLIPDIDINELPHGSGINADWHVSMTSKMCKPQYMEFSNSYHAMNQNGMYTGWVDFSVRYTMSGEYDSLTVDKRDCEVIGEDWHDLQDYLSECTPDNITIGESGL